MRRDEMRDMAFRVAKRHLMAESEKQKKWQEYFRGKMKEYGISSPAELKTEAERKKFFEDVDKGWKTEDE